MLQSMDGTARDDKPISEKAGKHTHSVSWVHRTIYKDTKEVYEHDADVHESNGSVGAYYNDLGRLLAPLWQAIDAISDGTKCDTLCCTADNLKDKRHIRSARATPTLNVWQQRQQQSQAGASARRGFTAVGGAQLGDSPPFRKPFKTRLAPMNEAQEAEAEQDS